MNYFSSIEEIYFALGGKRQFKEIISDSITNVHVSKNYIIKEYFKNNFSNERTGFIKDILDQLKHSKLNCPRLIKLGGSDGLLESEQSYILITNVVSGSQIYKSCRSEKGFFKKDHIVNLAEFMSRTHEFFKCVDITDDKIDKFCIFQKLPNRIDKKLFYNNWLWKTDDIDRKKIIDKIKNETQEFVDLLSNKSFKEGLIHNDLIPRNLTYKDEEIAGVFDFDFCNYGNYIYDLCWTLDWIGYPRTLTSKVGFKPRTEEMMLFIKSYFNQTSSIGDDKISLISSILPIIKLNFSLSVSHHLYLKGNKNDSIRELGWILEFLEYYKKYPLVI